MRVLLVDDEKLILKGMSHLLDILQQDCMCAHNGKEALQAIDRQQVDLVISDIHMPRMNGFQLAQAIRQKQPDLPIVLITGCIWKDLKERAAKVGVRRILRKPFKFNNLLEIITEIEDNNRKHRMVATKGGED